MSKRWVKLSRGVLIGSLLMLGTGSASAENETELTGADEAVVQQLVAEDEAPPATPVFLEEAVEPAYTAPTVQEFEAPAAQVVDLPLDPVAELPPAELPPAELPAAEMAPTEAVDLPPTAPPTIQAPEADLAPKPEALVGEEQAPIQPPSGDSEATRAIDSTQKVLEQEPPAELPTPVEAEKVLDEVEASSQVEGSELEQNTPPAKSEAEKAAQEAEEAVKKAAEDSVEAAEEKPEKAEDPSKKTDETKSVKDLDAELEVKSNTEEPAATSDEPESPPIVNIEVEGNKSVPTQAILEVVSTRIGDPLLKPRLRRDLQAIFDLGYFTDVRFATPTAPGGLRLVFRVLENPVVKSVEFEGNEVVDSTRLRAQMETESGQILNTRTIHSDIQAINQFYNEELGYLLTPTHVDKVSFRNGRLILKMVDGIVVNDVDVTGVSVFPQEKVESLVRIKPGELFNRKTLEEDLTNINELYEDGNWVLDTVDPKIDPDTGKVTINVLEAEVEEIRVEGNTKTRTATILRNLRTKPGTVLNQRRFRRDLERLNNLGYFRKVEPDPQRGSEKGKVILVLDVEEEKTGLATIGVGYAGGGASGIRSGVTGAISYSDRNLFGEGKNVSVNWQRGAQISSVGVSYLDPAINGNQDSLGISLFRNDVDGLRQPIIVDGEQQFAFYDDQRIGGSITYGRPLSDDLRIFGTLRHETIEIVRDSDSLFEPVGLGTGTLNSVGVSALYDTRDDLYNPHVGSFANAAVNVAGLGGDFNFTKYTLEGRHYVPLGKNHTLALRGWGGVVTGDAPITEFFFAGGPDTLRGYQQNRFFGTRFFVANAEYRFPIGNIKFLRGAVFADAGTAYSPGDNINNKLFYNAGVGLRITFPALGLGVIRLDYAIGDDGGRTQIGIGQSF